jgi:hypothetical protein
MNTSRSRQFFVLTVALALAACAGGNAGLNSDMIEKAFGNYGVELLSDGDGRRVTSLFSEADGVKTTRTYAVVEFLGETRPAFAREDERIRSGGSIGATFRDAGWEIRKQHLFIGELEVPASYWSIAELMNITLPQTLALDQYLFIVTKDQRSYNYAMITELHHPAYLNLADLQRLYGEILFDDSNRDSIHDFLGAPPVK